jgi:hypothetical protein
MSHKVLLITLTFLLIFIIACNNQPKKTNNFGNPNGDSELALMMREMFDNSMKAKEQLQANESTNPLKRYDNMKSVEATEPEKANSPLFKAMADNYLIAVDEVNASKNPHKEFNAMVDNCMSCHEAMCPGPMVKIKRLYLD